MTPNPALMKSIEQLGYRVTVGDVAAQSGLELNLAQQGLLALASDAQAHLQVSQTGEIAFVFPENFRSILRNKFWRLRFQEWWEKVWRVLFYLIRISFGIVLIVSILLMIVAIAIIVIAMSSSRDGDGDSAGGGGGGSGRSGGGGIIFFPNFWISDLFYIFNPGYDYNYYERQKKIDKSVGDSERKMNFLEAVFSFLFGDGNPNIDLEERRFSQIGAVIRQNRGAVIAQQIAPYLDNIDSINQENEDYMIPVLARFNGYPQVSPKGEIIYYFPDLQVTAKSQKEHKKSTVAAYLKEKLWRFSEAGSGQILGAIGLGALNLILALVLGSLLQEDVVSQLGGLVAFVNSIYWLLLGYGSSFLAIPLMRYFWIQWQNGKIQERNQQRQARAEYLSIGAQELKPKLDYARKFAAEKVITEKDLAYSTEKDILTQEIEQSEEIDEQWSKRLEGD